MYGQILDNWLCLFMYLLCCCCLFVRVMVHVVAQCHEEGLEHYLRSYIKVKYDSINAGNGFVCSCIKEHNILRLLYS